MKKLLVLTVSMLTMLAVMMPSTAIADNPTESYPRWYANDGTGRVGQMRFLTQLIHYQSYFVRAHNHVDKNWNSCGYTCGGAGHPATSWTDGWAWVYGGPAACPWGKESTPGSELYTVIFYWTACHGGGKWYVSTIKVRFSFQGLPQVFAANPGWHELGPNRYMEVGADRKVIIMHHNNAACVAC